MNPSDVSYTDSFCHNLRRSMRHHDHLWFIYRHIRVEKPANELGETTIEPGNQGRFRQSSPRIRRANPESRERPRADRMPRLGADTICLSMSCGAVFCAGCRRLPISRRTAGAADHQPPNDPEPFSAPAPRLDCAAPWLAAMTSLIDDAI